MFAQDRYQVHSNFTLSLAATKSKAMALTPHCSARRFDDLLPDGLRLEFWQQAMA